MAINPSKILIYKEVFFGCGHLVVWILLEIRICSCFWTGFAELLIGRSFSVCLSESAWTSFDGFRIATWIVCEKFRNFVGWIENPSTDIFGSVHPLMLCNLIFYIWQIYFRLYFTKLFLYTFRIITTII